MGFGLPGLPDLPGLPGFPDLPGLPGLPEMEGVIRGFIASLEGLNLEEAIDRINVLPVELYNLLPDELKNLKLPEVPEIPIPDIPSLPDIPSIPVPEIPKIDLPFKLPDIPKTPWELEGLSFSEWVTRESGEAFDIGKGLIDEGKDTIIDTGGDILGSEQFKQLILIVGIVGAVVLIGPPLLSAGIGRIGRG